GERCARAARCGAKDWGRRRGDGRSDAASGDGVTDCPQRTCIGCRQVRPKADLVRLTRGDNADVVVDGRRAAPGGGAYVCPTLECLEQAFGHGRLARALKGSVRLSGVTAAQMLESWRRR